MVETKSVIEERSSEIDSLLRSFHRLFIEDNPSLAVSGDIICGVGLDSLDFDRRIEYPREWESALSAVLTNEAGRLSLDVRAPDQDGIRGRSLRFRFEREETQGIRVSRVRFSASPSLVISGLVPPVPVWSSLLMDAATAMQAMDGFLTLDRAANIGTAYERHLRRLPAKGVIEADFLLRGYFWGTLLSGRHIQGLGGVESVRATAPVVRVVDLSTEDHELLYLQLSEDLFDVDGDAERHLREYLMPVLPSGA